MLVGVPGRLTSLVLIYDRDIHGARLTGQLVGPLLSDPGYVEIKAYLPSYNPPADAEPAG